MSPREVFALRDYLGPELKGRTISDGGHIVSLTDILSKTCLDGRVGELSGRSVLLSVTGQLIAGLAMIEIDGSPAACCCARRTSIRIISAR